MSRNLQEVEMLIMCKADNKDLTEDERKDKATDIALKYNFVTDLTSLVVVKPPAESEDPKKSVAKLTPVSKKRFPELSIGGFSAMAFSAKVSAPFLRTSGGSRRRRPPPMFQLQSINPVAAAPSVASLPGRLNVNFQTTSTAAPSFFTTTSTTTTTTTKCIPAACKIELFPKTLLRETGVTISDDTEDLAAFDNKTESLKVSGNCRWEVWTDKNFEGVSQTFAPGEYKNAATLRKVLRKASSVKNLGCD